MKVMLNSVDKANTSLKIQEFSNQIQRKENLKIRKNNFIHYVNKWWSTLSSGDIKV